MASLSGAMVSEEGFIAGILGHLGRAIFGDDIFDDQLLDHNILQSLCHGGEVLAQRLATDVPLQRSFEKLITVAQQGRLNEETLQALAEEYLSNEEKALKKHNPVQFGKRTDPTWKKNSLALGVISFVALANTVAAIPGYALHGVETPLHMAGNMIMKSMLNNIYNGPIKADRVRSQIMNGPCETALTFGEIAEGAVSAAIRATATVTAPAGGVFMHGFFFPWHVLMKGATSFLVGTAMMPVENHFGQQLTQEEVNNPAKYEETTQAANQLVQNEKDWGRKFYTGRTNESLSHKASAAWDWEQIENADYHKLNSFSRTFFDMNSMRAAYAMKRQAMVNALGVKEALASLFNQSKQTAKKAAYGT